METKILHTRTRAEREEAVSAAVELLRKGEVVGLPTETVYGLGADAGNDSAVAKIFEVKERPRFDPLIVHLPESAWVAKLGTLGPDDEEWLTKVLKHHWPGPLTVLLTHKALVSDLVTAGLPTVAVRVSAHPIFAEIVTRLGRPIAAPSANRFGRVSPTSAEDVKAELDGKIPLIIDAGPATHGVESTIIAPRGGGVEILRPGPITAEQLQSYVTVLPPNPAGGLRAPGQLPSHYAPATPLVLVDRLADFPRETGRRVGGLAWRAVNSKTFTDTRVLSAAGDLREAAANLFRCLRALDAAGLDMIVAERVPDVGLGTAILDRLTRAAAKRG